MIGRGWVILVEDYPVTVPRPRWSASIVLTVALVAVSCGGRGAEPPRPDRSLVPDAVGLADHWESLPCGGVRFTLASGARVEVVRAGSQQEACPGQTPTPILLGEAGYATNGAEAGRPWASGAPLILSGADPTGRWWATVLGTPRCFGFSASEGAYADGRTLHLTSGLVLPLAPTFLPPDNVDDPFPLRGGDTLCLDDEGRVQAVHVWGPT